MVRRLPLLSRRRVTTTVPREMDLLYSRKVNRQRWWTRGREGRWGSLEHEGVRGIEVESSVIHACMHACKA